MVFWASQSITLSERTFNAWKSVGAKFFTPQRSDEYIKRIVRQSEREEEFFINLGRVELAALSEGLGGLPVWNNGPDVVWPLNTPFRTRELFHDLMAPQSGEAEHIWIKEPGWGGRGKEKVRTEDVNLAEIPYWEDHIEGDEYRIITVGNLRVQQFRKEGEPGAFRYTWLRMLDLPESAKQLVKRATERLPRRSVIGWDVIVPRSTDLQHRMDDRVDHLEPDRGGERSGEGTSPESGPSARQGDEELSPEETGASSSGESNLLGLGAYLIEGNTTPGVNNATAERIVSAIRQLEENEYAIL